MSDEKRERKTLEEFQARLHEKTIDQPPEIARAIRDNFWELFDANADAADPAPREASGFKEAVDNLDPTLRTEALIGALHARIEQLEQAIHEASGEDALIAILRDRLKTTVSKTSGLGDLEVSLTYDRDSMLKDIGVLLDHIERYQTHESNDEATR